MDWMYKNNKIIIKLKKIILLYIIFLLVVSFSPILGVSDSPIIDIINPSDDPFYTNKSYVNISVNVSDSTNVSSFIDWDNSLIGYWNFEHIDEENNRFNDSSTYLNQANCTGSRNVLHNITAGKYGQGFMFNGSGQGYLDVPHKNCFNISNNFTIELWFKEFETTFITTFNGGDNKNDEGYAVLETSDGGYILTGMVNSTSIASNDGDLCLIKTDSSGNEEFFKSDDTPGEDWGDTVKQTNDGGYIITGRRHNISSQGHSDIWVIKTDSEGKEGTEIDGTWNETYDFGGKNDTAYDLVIDESGYSITGLCNQSGFFTGTMFYLKIDNNGNENFKTNSSSIGEGRCIKKVSDYYVTTGDRINPKTDNTEDLTFRKIDSSGEIIDITEFGGYYGNKTVDMDDHGEYIDRINDDFIVVGWTDYPENDTKNLFLVKLNNSGKKNKSSNIIGKDQYNDTGRCINKTNSGNYVITGYTESYGNIGNKNIWLVKINSTLNEVYNKTYGMGAGWSIQETSDGGYILTGWKNSTEMENRDIALIKTDINGNITNSNQNQSLNKTLIGKGRDTYQLELNNGAIKGYINNSNVINHTVDLYNLSQEWNHLVFRYNGTNVSLYLNKEKVNETNFSNTIDNNIKDLTIGKNFSGTIDEVRIWNRSLSRKEIYASYDANSTGSYYNNFTNLLDGEYRYYSHGINTGGMENTNINKTVIIDGTPPTCNIGFNDTTDFYNSSDTVKIFANFTESGSGINSSTVKIAINFSEVNNNISWTNMNITNNTNFFYNLSIPDSSNSDGIIHINITAEDNASNNITISNTNKSVDNTPSEISNVAFSSVDDDSATITWDTNENATSRVEYSTDESYNQNQNNSNFVKSHSINLLGLEDDKKYYYRVISYDIAGNMNISTGHNFTTAESLDDPGGGYTPPNQNSEEEEETNETLNNQTQNNTNIPNIANNTENNNITINKINSSENKSINININHTIVVKIDITPYLNLSDVNITIDEDEIEKPSNVSEPTKDIIEEYYKNKTINNTIVYRYLSIKILSNKTYIVDKNLKNAKIFFKINKTWIKTHNNSKDFLIDILRYKNEKWEVIKTDYAYSTEDENYLIFESTTPGFSTFAVVGSNVVEKGKPYEEPEEKIDIPWILIVGIIISAIVILIIMLFKSGHIYRGDEKK